MKRYEQILNLIEELENEERKLENAREDNFAKMQKNPSNLKELENYDGKLLDMLIVLAKRVDEHKRHLSFIYEGQVLAMIDEDGILFRHKILDVQEMERLSTWLNLMQEEVK